MDCLCKAVIAGYCFGGILLLVAGVWFFSVERPRIANNCTAHGLVFYEVRGGSFCEDPQTHALYRVWR